MTRDFRHSADEPKKRPSQVRSAQTVASIIEAAARILETGDRANFNTNAIAKLAGVSPGSLYQYFPNKWAIYSALVRREAELLLRELREVAEPARPGALKRLIDRVILAKNERPRLTGLLIVNEPSLFLDPDAYGVAQEAAQIMAQVVQAEGYLPRNPLDAALDCMSLIKALTLASALRTSQDDPQLKVGMEGALRGYLGSLPTER